MTVLVSTIQFPACQTRFKDLAVIAPVLVSLKPESVQAVVTTKTASDGKVVVLSLYHTEYLPKDLHSASTAALVQYEANRAAFTSALIAQITFNGPALVADRVLMGVAAPPRASGTGSSAEQPSFKAKANAANRVYRWIADQARQVPDFVLPWEPYGYEELSPEVVGELEKANSKAKKNDTTLTTSDVLCCTIL